MKADLINAYGDNEGLRKHIREEYAQLEKKSYKFVTGDELCGNASALGAK